MQERLINDCPPISVNSLFNIRDLGGYLTQSGSKTICRRFVRSDAPSGLSEEDLAVLLAYPVSQVIDLRSQSELDKQPHDLRQLPGVSYHHIPLLGPDLEKNLAGLQDVSALTEFTLADLYRYILDMAQPAVGSVMRTLAANKKGSSLFNCSHGKDRTGLISALLLSLAGVSQEHIVHDYKISAELLKPWFDTFIHKMPEKSRHFFTTPAHYMEATLQYLTDKYESVPAYLNLCGVDQATQVQLRRLLLESVIS